MIERRPLRTDVLDECLARLIDGRLPVGRINESELSEELGISRTPLREALLTMHQRGLLQSTPGRGFQVPPLTLDEARDLYELLSVLEPMAIRVGFTNLKPRAAELRAVLTQLAQGVRDLAHLRELSEQWSGIVREAVPNRLLKTTLTALHRLAARYEFANLSHGFPVENALAKHRKIVDALKRGDVETTAKLTGETWQDCLAALSKWLPAAEDIVATTRRFKR